MSREHLRTTYSQRIEQFREAIRHRTRLINYISLARLSALVAVVWFLVLGVRNQGFLFYMLSVLMLILFLILVSLHNKHKVRRELFRQLDLLNEKELSCLDHSFQNLPDGKHHADLSHPWSHDLDIFGNGSLFQYLNRTSTLKGDLLLAQLLTTEPG